MTPELTQIQAETLARLYYRLPRRNYKGTPLKHQQVCFRALHKKGLVTQDHMQITQFGIWMLRWYVNMKRRAQNERPDPRTV